VHQYDGVIRPEYSAGAKPHGGVARGQGFVRVSGVDDKNFKKEIYARRILAYKVIVTSMSLLKKRTARNPNGRIS
jgi:hypothetical protein